MKKLFTLLTLLLCAVGGVQAVTATWDFAGNSPTGIQSVNYGANEVANIASTLDGVDLYVNTGSGGKFSMNGGTQYIQMASGTISRVPVVSTNDVVTIDFAGNSGYCTISSPHTATAEEVTQGYVEIGVSENSTYFKSITVNLAYMPPTPIVAKWDWENNLPSGIRNFTDIQGSSSEFQSTIDGVDLTVDATASGAKFGPNDGNPQCTAGTILRVPVSSTTDVITVKFHSYNFAGGTIGGIAFLETTASYTATATDVAHGSVDIVSGGSYIYSVTLTKAASTTVTISNYKWATFASDQATDFTDLSGIVDAYIVTGHNEAAIIKSAVTTKAAEKTGLLLNAEAGTYVIPLSTSGTDYSSTNKFVAGTGTEIVAEAGKTKYVLSLDNSNNIAFMKIGSNPATVSADKAYLQFDEEIAAPMFGFGDATGVNEVRSQMEDVRGDYYNLNGQRVAQPTKGLYIVNGKKVIIK